MWKIALILLGVFIAILIGLVMYACIRAGDDDLDD